MADLQPFTLSQLKELIEGKDEYLVGNYISQNLAIARNVREEIVKKQFSNGPVLMPDMRILIIKQGWARPVLNLMERHISVGDLVFLSPNCVVEITDFSPDVKGIGLSMSNDLFSLAIGNRIPQAFDGHVRDFQLRLDVPQMAFLDHIHELLYQLMQQQEYSPQVMLHLISTFLWQVDHLWSEHEQTSHASQSRDQHLFTEFVQLVSQHAATWHTIEPYASQLCITPRYLSTIIKQVSGKSAKQWIDEALATRIKIELKHTRKPIALICEELNFPNPSFFTKFFKRMTGTTPFDFRR
jgi:AraC-like DNA-binding protein